MKRILQITAIAVFTIAFLYWFLRNANLADVWSILETTDPIWLAIALAINFSALLFRTARWRILLDPDHPPPLYATFFATTVGYMLSTILPIRASDVARPALLARRTQLRFSGALGTVLIERVLDLYSILLLFVAFSIRRWDEFSPNPSFFIVKAGAIACASILALMTFFVVGLYFFRGMIRRFHEALGRLLPARFRGAWMNFFDKFVDTFRIMKHPTAAPIVLLSTVGIWFCLTSKFIFTVLALHHPLPWDSSIFVTGITTVGLAIPTPGGVGGFHKACQLVLTHFYGFEIDASVATAVLFHVVGTLPVLVTGLFLFAREGLRWRDVRDEIRD
ncbi:MAG TPA: lysylphosphatidylglycerol synthase transmembrane domain-containing protein [Thermoanaerobaculia bacterium]|nr:lysylphosphatidylglycerol synthase transmembrane domain-containing protein [Thermoanaerobaculia bacterium]